MVDDQCQAFAATTTAGQKPVCDRNGLLEADLGQTAGKLKAIPQIVPPFKCPGSSSKWVKVR